MNRKKVKNIGASVRQRLLNKSKERKEGFQYVLTRFAGERFLYRLSLSSYAKQFILKGASLFFIWEEQPHRPTKDVDLLGLQPDDPQQLKEIFKEICSIPADDDGLTFDLEMSLRQDLAENDSRQSSSCQNLLYISIPEKQWWQRSFKQW